MLTTMISLAPGKAANHRSVIPIGGFCLGGLLLSFLTSLAL